MTQSAEAAMKPAARAALSGDPEVRAGRDPGCTFRGLEPRARAEGPRGGREPRGRVGRAEDDTAAAAAACCVLGLRQQAQCM